MKSIKKDHNVTHEALRILETYLNFESYDSESIKQTCTLLGLDLPDHLGSLRPNSRTRTKVRPTQTPTNQCWQSLTEDQVIPEGLEEPSINSNVNADSHETKNLRSLYKRHLSDTVNTFSFESADHIGFCARTRLKDPILEVENQINALEDASTVCTPVINLNHDEEQFDQVDGIGVGSPNPGSSTGQQSFEPHDLGISMAESQAIMHLYPELNFPSPSSPTVIRSHSVGCSAGDKSNISSLENGWSAVGDSSTFSSQCVRRVSVHSAPDEARYRVRMKPKRSNPKKWFKLNFPRAPLGSKSFLSSNRSNKSEGEKRSSRLFSSFSMSSSKKVSRAPNCDRGLSSSTQTTSPKLRESPPDQSSDEQTHGNLADERARTETSHRLPVFHSLAQLIPRIFRGQIEPPAPFFLGDLNIRLKKTNTSTYHRSKKYKRRGYKVGMASSNSQAPEKSDEQFELSPLYSKQNSLDHQYSFDNELFRNGLTSLGGDQTYHTNSSHNQLPNQTDIIIQNQSTVEINSIQQQNHGSNLNIAAEVSRIYQGVIRTAEGDNLIQSAVQTWEQFTDKAAQVLDDPNVSAVNVDGQEQDQTSKPLGKHMKCNQDYVNSTGDRKFHDTVCQGLPHCNEIDFPCAQSVTANQTNTNHDSDTINEGLPMDNDIYPYAQYVAAMIDALSQRMLGKISEDDLELRFRTLEAEATAARYQRSRFYSVGHDSCVKNAIPTVATRPSISEYGSSTLEPDVPEQKEPMAIVKKLQEHKNNEPEDFIKSEELDLHNSFLAQIRRLEDRNKLVITAKLLDRLAGQTSYPAFEADILQLLGRQPSWRRISILYYLTRRVVRHLLKNHLKKLEKLKQPCTESDERPPNLQNEDGHGEQVKLDSRNPAYDTIMTEIARYKASVERMKDFTITFFTRWYSDWVCKHGGWSSVLDDAEDSEVD